MHTVGQSNPTNRESNKQGVLVNLKPLAGITSLAVVALLAVQCQAQQRPNAGQCEQVRGAIAQYGLQAARKHAIQNYGLTHADLRRIEQECKVTTRSGHRS